MQRTNTLGRRRCRENSEILFLSPYHHWSVCQSCQSSKHPPVIIRNSMWSECMVVCKNTFHEDTSNIKLASIGTPNRHLCFSPCITAQTLCTTRPVTSIVIRVQSFHVFICFTKQKVSQTHLASKWDPERFSAKNASTSQCNEWGVDSNWELHWQLWWNYGSDD
jgi:hypothetical protein